MKQGFTFLENQGASTKVSLNGDDEYYWFSDYPYKIHHRSKWKSADAFKEITKLPEHKSLWQNKCATDLDDLLTRDCKGSFQINVDTQDLTAHESDVTDFLNNYQFLKISSPMATRKSNIIEEVVKQAKDDGKSVLFITNRVSLSLDIAEKYNKYGLSHYQTRDYKKGDSLVVQFDSLYRYSGDFDAFDIVILDEVTSLMLYMSRSYKGKEKIHAKNIYSFFDLRNKKFVIADSFMIDFPFKGRTLGIYNHFRESLHVTDYEDKKQFTNKVFELIETTVINKKLISVSSNEKGYLIGVQDELLSKGYRVLLLTADTEDKEEIYKVLEQSTIPYDAILFSPTLTVGVSIFSNVEHHFHYDTSGTVSVIDSIQMTRRSRESKNVHLFIRGRSSFKDVRIKEVERRLDAHYQSFDRWGEFQGITEAGKFLASIKQIRNILDNTHKYAFKSLLCYQFKSIDIDETVFKETKKKEPKQTLDEARALIKNDPLELERRIEKLKRGKNG